MNTDQEKGLPANTAGSLFAFAFLVVIPQGSASVVAPAVAVA